MPDVSSSQRILSKAYADSQRNNPAPKKVPMTGMASGMTNKGMKSGTSINNGMSDQDYLGYGFDAAVRKGVDAAREAMRQRISRLDEGKQRALMARFESEIASQKSLRMAGRDGEREVAAYRDAAKRGETINYQKARMRMNNLQPARATPKSTPSPYSQPFKRDSAGYMGEMGF